MKHSFLFRHFLQFLRVFARSESGMTLPLLAVSMVAITGMTGLAIDTARMQLVQSKLQSSLDAAGLAGGATVSTENLNTEVSKYLNVNFNGYMGATVTGSSVSINSSNTILTLSATATIPSTFLNVIGISTITVNASSQITRAVTGLELVMVLDNTGSMTNSAGGSETKLQALQSASVTLINSLFAAGSANLWVGIVPFSEAVNIGTGHPTWMNTTYDTGISTMQVQTTTPSETVTGPGWGTTSWTGCVDARLSGEDIIDDPPGSGSTLFEAYYWPSDNLNYTAESNTPNSGYNPWATLVWKRCKGSSCSNVNSTCSTSGGYTCTFNGYTYESPLNSTNQGPNLECPQQVTTMTNNSSSLITAVDAMTAQGDTEINQGMFWGWAMLSPRWQGLWGGSMSANGLPLAYGTPGMAKAVILMTDGYDTIDNLAHGAYWFLENGRTGSTNSATAVSDLDSKTLAICNAMKAKGIYIYTVALGTETDAASLALLQNCATASNYYFNSPSTSQLQGIFNTIGDSLSNLRVSQ